MSTQTIQINPNPNPTPSQPAVFAAATANAGDTVNWHNADAQPHWPAPSASNKTGWFSFQIPAGATSDTLALGPNTAPNVNQPYVLNYVCANHPSETGKITVNPQP
jgi:plastocyanin